MSDAFWWFLTALIVALVILGLGLHHTGLLEKLLKERPVTSWLIKTMAAASVWPMAKEFGELAGWIKRVATNFPAVAVMLLDCYAYATPDMHEFIQKNPTLLALICVLNIVVRLAKPKADTPPAQAA